MLPFLPEYRIRHPRFPVHARVAYLMSMVAPACGLFLAYYRNLGNLWLWAACCAGLALALCLYSVIAMHEMPPTLSRLSVRLVEQTDAWFPYFFVVIQSVISSLILVFMWYAVTTLALPMPVHVHALLVFLALLLPFRRYTQARILQGTVTIYDRRFEYMRGAWHIMATFVITQLIQALTAYDVLDRPHENLHWHTTLWVPASLYMLFAFIMMLARLNKIRAETHTPANASADGQQPDRF